MTDRWGDPDPGRTWRPGVAAPEPDAERPEAAPPSSTPPSAPLYPASDAWSYFPPAGQSATPWDPPPRAPLDVRRHLTVLAWAALVPVLLGAPLALVWRAVTPPAAVARTASGPQLTALESDQLWAVDGWFVVVSLVVGVVAGGVAWLLLRGRGPMAPLGLALGGLAAAWVAARVGPRLVIDRYYYDFCHREDVSCIVYDGALNLHATWAVVVLPFAMLTVFSMLTAAFDRD